MKRAVQFSVLHHFPIGRICLYLPLLVRKDVAILDQLKKELSPECVDFAADDMMEQLAMCSEDMLTHFLSNGMIPDGPIAARVADRQVFPCFFGSALKMQGVDALLDALVRYAREGGATITEVL